MSIQFQSAGFSYNGTQKVLTSVTFEIVSGSSLLLVGHNGAGKSTLLKLLNGILVPTEGRVTVNGLSTHNTPVSRLAAEVCITFQNPADQIFASTVAQEAEFAPRNLRRKEYSKNAASALDLFGLNRLADIHPYDLSLAQRKLLTLASAVAADTPILAFDEPTVNLSEPERRILHDAVSRLRAGRKTVIMISHDYEFALHHCDRVVVLRQGHVDFLGAPQEFLRSQDALRKSGIRLPLSMRLRPHVGLPLL